MLFSSKPHPVFCLFLLVLWCHAAVRLPAQDTYRVLQNEREALRCRFDLMKQAREEVLLATYIIKDDLIGLASLELMVQAARRGVIARLLVDDLGNRLPYDLLRYLEENGVQVRIFNPSRLPELRTVVDRMHGKMLITENRQFIVGGRNLNESYFALDQHNNFLDREVYVCGEKAVQTARNHFYTMWNFDEVTQRGRRDELSDKKRLYWSEALRSAPDSVSKRLLVAFDGLQDWSFGLDATAEATVFFHDKFVRKNGNGYARYERKDKSCTDSLIALVEKAQVSIDIENAYFIPTKRWFKALKAARKRGVRIRVLTNSGYTNDVPLIQSVYQLKRKKYRKAGFELWEYQGQKMLHTKAMVVDSAISVIGSYNLEIKSQNFNTEVAACVRDQRVARTNLAIFHNNLRRSVQVGSANAVPEAPVLPPTDEQKKRKRKADRLTWTLAPLADLVF
jgi:putative cardiolipin synthase